MLQEQMTSLKTRVTDMLIKFPKYRDDDYKLMAHIWMMELGGRQTCTELTAMFFLQIYAEAKLSHAESIRRIRQKIQEQRPELRGHRWQERCNESEIMRKDVLDL